MNRLDEFKNNDARNEENIDIFSKNIISSFKDNCNFFINNNDILFYINEYTTKYTETSQFWKLRNKSECIEKYYD